MGTYTIAVIAGKDYHCIFPKIIPIDGINNLSYFSIYFFYQAIISISVHTPVFGGKTSGWIYIVVIDSFTFNDVSIIRVFGKIGRQSRTIPYIRYINISIREVLTTCIFADIMWVVIGSHQKKRLFMFTREIFGTSFCQPIITMFIYIVEAIFFVWNFE